MSSEKANGYLDHLAVLALYRVNAQDAIQKVRKRFLEKEIYFDWDPVRNILSYRDVFRGYGGLRKAREVLDRCWREVIEEAALDNENESLYPLPNRLRQLRKEQGLTQAELAEKADVYTRLVQKIERGEVDMGKVPFNHVMLLANALGVTPMELIVEPRASDGIQRRITTENRITRV